ncbi:MAG: integrase arm-type DNA-binding domain-containing protein, partial [Zoogloeaceae bacterium]|nr:integrase arm-type DNA-binding domain-containing protein [Zoogloeaceae bacterium]
MALSDAAIRGAKPKNKPYKMYDEKGLYLEVSPAGGKLWRLKYRFAEREKLLALGRYPDVGLKEARERRDDARKLLANSQDPGELKKMQKAAIRASDANSFEAVAREWFGRWRMDKAESHAKKIIARLESDVFPWIGKTAVSGITAPLVLSVLRRIESKGAFDTAHRVKGNVSMVMRYAIATGRAERDPCPDLKGALPPKRTKHFPAITNPDEVGELMRKIAGYKGSHVVRAALKLAPLAFVRPVELRRALWRQIDMEKGEWAYTATKTGTPHIVPLSRQALAILEDLHPLTGHHEYVFA